MLSGKNSLVWICSYKTNRKKLMKAYSDKSPLADIAFATEDKEYIISSSSGRMLLLHTGMINLKASRTTQGVAVLKLKKGHRLFNITEYKEGTFSKPARYRTRNLPALGALPSAEDTSEQLSII